MARISKAKSEETAKRFEALKKELLHTNKAYRDDLALSEAKMNLAMELMNKRHEANLLQGQLAALAGKEQGTISRIERMDVNPTLKVIAEIAMAMNKKVVIRFEDFEDMENFKGKEK